MREEAWKSLVARGTDHGLLKKAVDAIAAAIKALGGETQPP